MSGDGNDLFKALKGQDRRFDPGAYLFHQGDPVSGLFLVVEGEVQLLRHQKAGDAIILQQARPGDIVAEASVFADGYHCDAVARTAATVRRIRKDGFLRHFRQNADFAQAWAAHLAREVRFTRMRNEILSLKTVAERLEAWLSWHGGLPPKGEWNQLARQIGVSPEALYREIAKWRR